ncbi:MAG: dTMP kinase [Clostridiales bacterium]|nr:dTMP kinase [Clostridiales bacterium]
MKYTTIFFDLDGTLTKSEKGITRSALYACEKMGFTGYTEEQFKVFIGPPLYESFQKVCGMTPEQAHRAIELYRERFSVLGWAENEVYTGIAQLLRSLKKNGCKIAITTAKPQAFAEKIAKKFGFEPYLDALIGPGMDNTHASKAWIVKKAIEQLGGTPVMIGDRCYDVDGGRENGIDTIGVCYGYGTREELEEAGATHIAETVEELTSILLGDAPRARGVFITMEGVDGCGKTTQRNALIAHLEQLGWDVQLTREPGGDAVAEKIRELILDPANTAMDDLTEAYLYAASRAQNVRAKILPALDAGKAVVCDRFVDSSIAYQGGGRQLGTQKVAAINRFAIENASPDITVYLRMPPEKALSRRLSASEPDRLEREKASFFERTYAAYEELYAQKGMERVVTVNAGGSIEEVSEEMIAAVDAKLRCLRV